MQSSRLSRGIGTFSQKIRAHNKGDSSSSGSGSNNRIPSTIQTMWDNIYEYRFKILTSIVFSPLDATAGIDLALDVEINM